jgi:hypothetical protein
MASGSKSMQLTRELLKKRGAFFGTTEQRLPNHMTKDLFGFVDGIALCPEEGIIALQVTTNGQGPARVHKIREDFCWPKAQAWLSGGGKIQVWDWRRRQVGGRSLWKLRIADVVNRHSDIEWRE